jgi:hypothetical protein
VRRFVFDAVLDDVAEQSHLYSTSGAGVVQEFLNGVNGLVIAYGQTGSGKTFSMFGPEDGSATSLRHVYPTAGIVPRALAEILTAVSKRRAHGLQIQLHLSVVDVYGNVMSDLLRDRQEVGAWHGVAARAVAANAVAFEITSTEQAEYLLQKAERAKRRAATAMNERSSRAHTLLLLSLSQADRRRGVTVKSSLCLADLGGSEQLKKSKVRADANYLGLYASILLATGHGRAPPGGRANQLGPAGAEERHERPQEPASLCSVRCGGHENISPTLLPLPLKQVCDFDTDGGSASRLGGQQRGVCGGDG